MNLKTHTYSFSLLLLFLISCKETTKEKTPNTVNKAQSDTNVKKKVTKKAEKSLSFNEAVIIELKKMKEAIQKKDKEKLSTYFDFPIKKREYEVIPFISYEKLQSISKDIITKVEFIKLSKIEEGDGELNDLFLNLDLDNLKTKDSVTKDVKLVDTIIYIYSITIDPKEENIVLSLRLDNKAEGNDSETFYYFKLINNKLIYSKSMMAG